MTEAPGDADTDFEIAGDKVVDAGAQVVLGPTAGAALREDAKILAVDGPALVDGNLEHRGRNPDIELIAFGTVVGVAHRGIPFPAIGQLPSENVCGKERGGRVSAKGGHSCRQHDCALRSPGILGSEGSLEAVEQLAVALDPVLGWHLGIAAAARD